MLRMLVQNGLLRCAVEHEIHIYDGRKEGRMDGWMGSWTDG